MPSSEKYPEIVSRRRFGYLPDRDVRPVRDYNEGPCGAR